jgi:hypothetical protein
MLGLISQATRCTGDARSASAVRQAQLAAADPSRGTFAGPDLDTLGDAYRSDGCHFNTMGRERVVEMLISSISALAPLGRGGS